MPTRLSLDDVRPEMDAFETQFRRFRRASASTERGFRVDWSDRIARLDDGAGPSGYEPHYTYHPAWAARVLAHTCPSLHIDVSSSLDFVAIASAFVPMEFYDFRPADLTLENLSCKRGDLTELPFETRSVESLSCMHVVEHIGLGRYGDPLEPRGDLKAMAELSRVLAPGGSLLFVVPVGRRRLQFNAHRIYDFEQITSCFRDLRVAGFALVDDHGAYHADADGAQVAGQTWGCGCWWFRK